MVSYQKFNDGIMKDYLPTDEDLERGFASLHDMAENEVK